MNKEEFIKIIDGELYYKYDYAYWLYNQLEVRDNKINEAINYIKDICKTPFCDIEHDNAMELLEILKGEEDEKV